MGEMYIVREYFTVPVNGSEEHKDTTVIGKENAKKFFDDRICNGFAHGADVYKGVVNEYGVVVESGEPIHHFDLYDILDDEDEDE